MEEARHVITVIFYSINITCYIGERESADCTVYYTALHNKVHIILHYADPCILLYCLLLYYIILYCTLLYCSSCIVLYPTL